MESVGPEAWTFLNVPSQLLQLANFFKAEEYSSLSLSLSYSLLPAGLVPGSLSTEWRRNRFATCPSIRV